VWGAEHVDRPGAGVGGKEERSVDVDTECETFVDGAVRGIWGFRIVDGAAQAETVPSSVSKMKMAGIPVPGTTNADDGFQMMPVGAAGVGFGAGAGGGLTVWQSVLGTTLPGRGIDTWSPCFTPVPS
jgi:hypothetical protein